MILVTNSISAKNATKLAKVSGGYGRAIASANTIRFDEDPTPTSGINERVDDARNSAKIVPDYIDELSSRNISRLARLANVKNRPGKSKRLKVMPSDPYASMLEAVIVVKTERRRTGVKPIPARRAKSRKVKEKTG